MTDLKKIFPPGSFIDVIGKRRAKVVIGGRWSQSKMRDSLPDGFIVTGYWYNGEKDNTNIEFYLKGYVSPIQIEGGNETLKPVIS